MKIARNLFFISIFTLSLHQFGFAQPYRPITIPATARMNSNQMRNFMRDLTEYVYQHHVVTTASNITYGMTYEFYEEGKKYQVFGLDSMHDGSWFAEAMLIAERIDPGAPYQEMAMQYQLPFYINMLKNSHILFPNKEMREGQDKKPIQEPLRGWVPRGWDDGLGFDLTNGKRFQKSYHTPSNHLAQDLADLLLHAWIVLRNNELITAMQYLYDYRTDYFGSIPHLAFALGYMTDNDKLMQEAPPPKFDPTDTLLYKKLYLQQFGGLETAGDHFEWLYRRTAASAVKSGTFNPEVAWQLAAQLDSIFTAFQHYYDDTPWPPGMFFFDIQHPPLFINGEGRLDKYHSDGGLMFGGRAVQLAGIGAAILPALRANKEVWMNPWHTQHPDTPRIPMIEISPVLDGKKDPVYPNTPQISDGQTSLTLLSDPKTMYLWIESQDPKLRVKIQHARSPRGAHEAGIVEILGQQITCTNLQGRVIAHTSKIQDGNQWTAEIRIPYTAAPNQAHWINGVDHAPYSIQLNSKTGMVYMLSSPERIITRLENIAVGSVQTWKNVWDAWGCIPSGYAEEKSTVSRWDVSDAGNIAHLIKTIAFVLIDQAQTSDWELMHESIPQKPVEIPPLPEETLKKQGIPNIK